MGTSTPERASVFGKPKRKAVAFVVTHAVGLDTNTAAADYIQLYHGNKATLTCHFTAPAEALRPGVIDLVWLPNVYLSAHCGRWRENRT